MSLLRRARRPRGPVLVAVASALLVALTACSSGDPAGTPPVPTFPGPGVAAPASAAPSRDTLVPTDCNQLLSKDDLPNLLGLPLGSVTVSDLRDVPAPNIGRLERVTCNYVSSGGPAAPPTGAQILRIISSGYNTPEDAQAQAAANLQAEQSAGVQVVPTPLGAAQAGYFDDPDGPLLVVVYGRISTSLTLGRSPVARDQARSVLVDLAQRILPVLVPPRGP